MDFLPLIQPERNSEENEGLRLIVRAKSQRRKMMNTEASKDFIQSQKMTSLIRSSYKIWLSTQMTISTNLSLKKI